MKHIKAIAFDLDGTLLKSNGKIDKETNLYIQKLINSGLKVIIATGRCLYDALPVKKELSLDTPLVTNNGSRIYYQDKLIKEYEIDKNIVNEILDLKIDNDIIPNLYYNEDWFVEKDIFIKEIVEYQEKTGYKYKISNFNNFRDKNITKLVYIGDHEKLLKLEKDIQSISNKIKTMFSTEYSLEIINANTSKAHAVFSILKNFNIDKHETIAFGDGFNDYELLNESGLGFIMGNAHYKLKESLPHLEVIDKNDNNGVLKKLINIFNI
ncbi:hypothetical protein EV215_0552 [Hypnocyclicus thermotrophus]|uniref:Cof subfamily protein (Haloacid dehalogenase superfamily)/HAD superfamily hydrolase (TIGR01484 family) n=1 Tax=Hypnocyclicus thermotrophus TaxID=1627895 RepID=A0AA46DZL4_9FUSO|nr:HAD family hydrolase [Hypnocyclicus thermotrophus]TDT71860.1 hypothetical protein EV215_0552 [Hypnocyclicus thermotrophus]